MAKTRSFTQSDAEKFVCDKTKGVSLGANDRYIYVNDKRTDTLENVILSAIVQGLGEVQLVYPPKAGLAEKLNQKFGHGIIFDFSDVAIYNDMKVSIYNGSLTFKFIVTEKEE